jgi:uncharacterized membrane protein SpoIIM required for sporulation
MSLKSAIGWFLAGAAKFYTAEYVGWCSLTDEQADVLVDRLEYMAHAPSLPTTNFQMFMSILTNNETIALTNIIPIFGPLFGSFNDYQLGQFLKVVSRTVERHTGRKFSFLQMQGLMLTLPNGIPELTGAVASIGTGLNLSYKMLKRQDISMIDNVAKPATLITGLLTLAAALEAYVQPEVTV